MKKEPQNTYKVDFTGTRITGTKDFNVSLHQGIQYFPEKKAWEVIPNQGFIQYKLILAHPTAVIGTATLATELVQGKVNAASAIIVNGLAFAPKFEVTDPKFTTLEWLVPLEFFFAGENTIITPLLPSSTSPIFVREVTVTPQ